MRSRFSLTPGRIMVASRAAEPRAEWRTALEIEGHKVTEAATCDQAVRRACHSVHDILILDASMDAPEGSDGTRGSGLCRAIRSKSGLGIVMVACDETTQERIDWLNAGADDFVSAPFIVAELLARVRAILRRMDRSGERNREIVLQDRTIDLKSHQVRGPGNSVARLTPKEFLVLQHLVTNADRPLPHQSLAQAIWQRESGGEYVRIVIGQLRRKLETDPNHPRYIVTERSLGYRFRMPPPAAAADIRVPESSISALGPAQASKDQLHQPAVTPAAFNQPSQ
jgi:DNA-binding response OmpR family regulator